jgi:hypothetical protein
MKHEESSNPRENHVWRPGQNDIIWTVKESFFGLLQSDYANKNDFVAKKKIIFQDKARQGRGLASIESCGCYSEIWVRNHERKSEERSWRNRFD